MGLAHHKGMACCVMHLVVFGRSCLMLLPLCLARKTGSTAASRLDQDTCGLEIDFLFFKFLNSDDKLGEANVYDMADGFILLNDVP